MKQSSSRWFPVPLAILLSWSSLAAAQPEDVALVARGADHAAAADAFETFVPLPPERRYLEAPDPPPDGVALLVTIDTDGPTVRVWRRADGATLERRFDRPGEDAYALALAAAELLEVARAGGDPATVGASVQPATEPAAPSPDVAPEPGAPEPGAPEPAPVEPDPVRADDVASPPEAPPSGGLGLAFTVGIAAEGWLFVEADAPWLVQPSLFVELLFAIGDGVLIGGGLFASALGAWSRADGGVQGRYERTDVGARFTVGGDVGDLRTRLLGHVRAGGAATVGAGEVEATNATSSATVAGGFVGASLEARQPLALGLELTLEVGVDAVPAPARFTAFGTPLLVESTVRAAGRLGLAWRFE